MAGGVLLIVGLFVAAACLVKAKKAALAKESAYEELVHGI